MISPHDPETLYHAGESLFKTTDGGVHWEAISPDLTRNDKSKQQPSGGPITIDDTGTEYYDTIFALAESPLTKGLIWAGTDDGLIQLTRDGGKTWTNVTPKDLPEWSRVSQIELRRSMPARPMSPSTATRIDDVHPYIYKTTRLRQDLDEGREGNSGQHFRSRRARRSQKARPALRWDRDTAYSSRSTTAPTGVRCNSICRDVPFTT